MKQNDIVPEMNITSQIYRKHPNVLSLIGVVLLTLAATPLFLYTHEWGHALGCWIEGYSPCVGLNNTWPAPPDTSVKTLVGGLMGPILSLIMGSGLITAFFYINSFKNWTFTLGTVNLVAHPIFVVASIFNLLAGYPTVFVDELALALMLPETQITDESLRQLILGIDNTFLLDPRSLILWLPAAIPLSLVLFTAIFPLWKGYPLQRRGSLLLSGLIVFVSIVTALVHAEVAKTEWSTGLILPSRLVCVT